jgi:trimeric autotransporter adhesin
VVTRRTFAVVAILALAGCSLDKQVTPPLSGPSELGLSLQLFATPDIITQDGQSQASVKVIARDASSQPVAGLALRVEVLVGGTPVDLGVLSTKSTSTGADGSATVTYRSPAAPPPSQTSDTDIEVAFTPVGTNYANASRRSVAIHLARPGVIQPPNGTPTPRFFFSPTAPKADDDVFFDGSASTDSDGSIVTYSWSFGDGRTEVSSSPSTRHHYGLAGQYSVTLTVTDNRGLSATSQPQQVTVGTAADPDATFVTSPAAPKAHQNVGFNASASKAIPGRTITTYIWEFGDASPVVTTSNPITNHSFAAAGDYNVTLKVIDDTGRFDVVTSSITICPPEGCAAATPAP